MNNSTAEKVKLIVIIELFSNLAILSANSLGS